MHRRKIHCLMFLGLVFYMYTVMFLLFGYQREEGALIVTRIHRRETRNSMNMFENMSLYNGDSLSSIKVQSDFKEIVLSETNLKLQGRQFILPVDISNVNLPERSNNNMSLRLLTTTTTKTPEISVSRFGSTALSMEGNKRILDLRKSSNVFNKLHLESKIFSAVLKNKTLQIVKKKEKSGEQDQLDLLKPTKERLQMLWKQIEEKMKMNIFTKNLEEMEKFLHRNDLEKNKKTSTVGSFVGNWTYVDLRKSPTDSNRELIPTYNLNLFNLSHSKSVLIYSAYLDRRKPTLYVRLVLIGYKKHFETYQLTCLFYTLNSLNETIKVNVTYYETCENHLRPASSFIGSCTVPRPKINLTFVQINVESEGLTIKMNLIDNKVHTSNIRNFSVCVPPLFGNISALRLMEFIELSQILGAEHFIFYIKNVTKDVKELLRYYNKLHLVTSLPWHLEIDNKHVWNNGQSASVWDCLYRNMYAYRHVAFIDFDEFIVPRQHLTWGAMLENYQRSESINDNMTAAYSFSSAFFANNFPKLANSSKAKGEEQLFVTINSTTRTKTISQLRSKVLADPLKVFELGIHHVSKPIEEYYKVHKVKPSFAILNHYRDCLNNYGMKCDEYVSDERAWDYKNELVANVKMRLYDLNNSKPNVLLS